jgi:hypothetical protein
MVELQIQNADWDTKFIICLNKHNKKAYSTVLEIDIAKI